MVKAYIHNIKTHNKSNSIIKIYKIFSDSQNVSKPFKHIRFNIGEVIIQY